MLEETRKALRAAARAEPLAGRARLMTTGAPDAPNGIRLVFVTIDDALDRAELEVHFFNENYLDLILNRFATDPATASRIFPLAGGVRRRAGRAAGQVRVAALAADADEKVLRLRVEPIGDYSTYRLELVPAAIDPAQPPLFDPLFAEIDFKFRPGCFNANCAPSFESAAARPAAPAIDYLAKDYESFRLQMIAAMSERVPGWQATSEADLDQVLLELFSAAADELSDYQDRVMNEAFFTSCRRRVSLARHARLVDYHIHEGHQASTPLALEIDHETGPVQQFSLAEGLTVWAGEGGPDADSAVVFVSRHAENKILHQLLNSIGLYTWSDALPALKAGSTEADLLLYRRFYEGDRQPLAAIDEASAVAVRNLINEGKIERLLIEERLNPATGRRPGVDRDKRQLLRLRPEAEALFDPIEGVWFVRARWQKTDALRRDYCFTIDCADGRVENVSLFHGNLIDVFHGRPRRTVFKESGSTLGLDPERLELYYERTRRGAVCRLPGTALAYRQTETGGAAPPVSTLEVVIDGDVWDEAPSLVHSDDSDENGDHFAVETDENRRSLIRFGDGVNGKQLPDGAVVECAYQTGEPLEGNVGAEKLVGFAEGSIVSFPGTLRIRRVWNPFDVTDGVERETAAEIVRRAPEAYRTRQLRAVTLADYVARAEKIEGVARAAASYAWTGSWRTVRVTIDPRGTNELAENLRREVAARLEAVRLIGEDIEIRPPRFVPLEIVVELCAAPDVWIEDIRFVLEQEFSAGRLPDGRRGFFHPDEWSFGQPLFESQIVGRALAVGGVEHVTSVAIKRFNEPTAGTSAFTALRPNEIIEVEGDPDHLERGFITFRIKGGRQ